MLRCSELLRSWTGVRLVPAPVLVELDHFVPTGAFVAFLEDVQRGAFVIEDLQPRDYARVGELLGDVRRPQVGLRRCGCDGGDRTHRRAPRGDVGPPALRRRAACRNTEVLEILPARRAAASPGRTRRGRRRRPPRCTDQRGIRHSGGATSLRTACIRFGERRSAGDARLTVLDRTRLAANSVCRARTPPPDYLCSISSASRSRGVSHLIGAGRDIDLHTSFVQRTPKPSPLDIRPMSFDKPM